LGSNTYFTDIDVEKVERLKAGKSGSTRWPQLVIRNRERLHFSTDVADAFDDARLLSVAVGTPPIYSGERCADAKKDRYAASARGPWSNFAKQRTAAHSPPRARTTHDTGL